MRHAAPATSVPQAQRLATPLSERLTGWARELRSWAVVLGAALGLLVVALLALAPATAWARSSHGRLRHAAARNPALESNNRLAATQTRRSVVVAPGLLAALDGAPLAGPSDRIRVSDPEWLANHAGRVVGRGDPIRCDLCVSSAARARQSEGRASEAVYSAANQVKSLGNQLTTLQISDATVKLTSLSPLGVQVRKPF